MTDMLTIDEYKTKVYEVARRVQKEQDWCEEGFEAVIAELGLKSLYDDDPMGLGSAQAGTIVMHEGSRVMMVRFPTCWRVVSERNSWTFPYAKDALNRLQSLIDDYDKEALQIRALYGPDDREGEASLFGELFIEEG